ncbi:MAG TPA: glycosyltransferase [Anaerohalosphaeraceae bacterium]|nr:glycosyltransferase [Anaerohalosphaeraceae bacterium]
MDGTGKKSQHIVVVTGVFPALSETFIVNPITHLVETGHSVRIFSMSPKPETARMHDEITKYRLLDCTIYPVAVSPGKWDKRWKAVTGFLRLFFRKGRHAVKILRANLCCEKGFCYTRLFFSYELFKADFDVVHCHFGPNAAMLVDLKKAGLDIPLITSFHGYDVNSYPRQAGEECYKDLFALGELFTANTNFTKNKMVRLGCPEHKIHIIHESLRCDKFFVPMAQRPASGDVATLLTVGRMVEKKGYAYSLKAMALLKSRGYRFRYWMVGDGPLMDHYQQMASELNITEDVTFLGEQIQSEVLNLYRQADIFILPSIEAADGDCEGQGLVLQEAQMAGIPVVSTLHNGIPDGVQNGITGFLVPEKDSVQLADKIEYLIQNPRIRREMGQCGQEFVRSKFDVRRVTEALIDLFQMVAGETH